MFFMLEHGDIAAILYYGFSIITCHLCNNYMFMWENSTDSYGLCTRCNFIMNTYCGYTVMPIIICFSNNTLLILVLATVLFDCSRGAEIVRRGWGRY